MQTSTDLMLVVGWNELQKLVNLVFNRYKLKIYGISVGGNDTDLRYQIFTKAKVPVKEIHILHAYMQGVLDCLKSF